MNESTLHIRLSWLFLRMQLIWLNEHNRYKHGVCSSDAIRSQASVSSMTPDAIKTVAEMCVKRCQVQYTCLCWHEIFFRGMCHWYVIQPQQTIHPSIFHLYGRYLAIQTKSYICITSQNNHDKRPNTATLIDMMRLPLYVRKCLFWCWNRNIPGQQSKYHGS